MSIDPVDTVPPIDESPPVLGPQPFDLYGKLPSPGEPLTTVLEASAGTGKTFAIATLVARFVAEEGVGLDQMLIVTFSRAATGELRERVRERLTSAERGLRDPAAARAATHDPLLRLLADGSEQDVADRRRRLNAALRAFDAATIATTHQFCAQVLAGLGVKADLAGGDRFVESLEDLVVEVAEDLYLRKFASAQSPDERPSITPEQAIDIAMDAAVREPYARLEPALAAPDTPAGMRRRLAEVVREEVALRKRSRGVRSYDDLQTGLAAVLTDPQGGESDRQRLQSRFPVVLIDEFQDTDPVQWEIVSKAFVGQVRLVLIGDPKQAIYGFRGADVMAYLRAVKRADVVETLECNWRSEQRLLDGLDALLSGCIFGNPLIAYRQVAAARPEDQLFSSSVTPPVRLRVVRRDGQPVSSKGQLHAAPTRARVAADVAADVVDLLSSDAEILRDPAGAEGQRDPLAPRDVAVLVRTNNQALLVREALTASGVPAVIGGASSVFTAPVAQDWLVLLEALEQPHRAGRVRAAAMSCFLGWSATRLALASSDETDALSGQIRSWAGVLADRGVAALQETITAAERLPARLLRAPDGERTLTDLRHIGQSLHGAAVAQGLGVTALVAWLRRRIEEADAPAEGMEERSRRLDSDAAAVQVVTIHRSKGLEFPVVYVPFAWDLWKPDIDRPRYHDANGDRVLDVGGGLGGSDPAVFSEGARRQQEEDAAEELRLLYVALTRARSRVILWWAPSTTAECAPLSRLLFGRGLPAGGPAMTIAVPSDEEAARLLLTIASGSSGQLAVEEAVTRPEAQWARGERRAPKLASARFDRELDLAWRRTSYSGLTAAAHDAGSGLTPAAPMVGSEPEHDGLDDETAGDEAPGLVPAASAGSAARVISPMAGLPGGTAFGSLVHGVLETVDPAADDLAAEVRARLGEQLGRWGAGPSGSLDVAGLVTALVAVYESPLGPTAGARRLLDFALADRLTEMSFELPLAGGDGPSAELTLGELAPVLRRHLSGRQPADPLAAYSERLGDPLLRGQSMRGFLNGSLDAVLRVRGASAENDSDAVRYVVVDYKTNWLGAAPAGSGELTAADYTPERLSAAMLASDYPLQALLYSVALHRYLRWRQPGYSPQQHLGGVLYLYVRGMCGPGTPLIDGAPCGVFAWQPPPELIVDLSELLDRGAPERVVR